MPGVDRSRPFAVGVLGASGYTGRLVVERLRAARPDWKLVVFGRRPQHLRAAFQTTNVDVYAEPVDVDAPASLVSAFSQASVVIACAGPFSTLGEPVVRACIATRTHYVDITGEVDYMRSLIDQFSRAPILIVPACGYDSVPSDLAVLYAAKQLHAPLKRARIAVSMRGSVSGGTFRTFIDTLSKASQQQDAVLSDPFALNAADDPVKAPGSSFSAFESDDVPVEYDASSGLWTGPSAMAPINTRVVRRTASLSRCRGALSDAYAKEFEYREVQASTSRLVAMLPKALTAIKPALQFLFSWTPVKRLVSYLAPTGANETARARNWFAYKVDAETSDGSHATVHLKGPDPYVATAETVALAAVCIVENGGKVMQRVGAGGVYTPAFALGHEYLQLLMKSPVLQFS
ncbi:Saccharopine dehydrogenase NADP binding domain-containing protein [Plasmodiophora brassicae]